MKCSCSKFINRYGNRELRLCSICFYYYLKSRGIEPKKPHYTNVLRNLDLIEKVRQRQRLRLLEAGNKYKDTHKGRMAITDYEDKCRFVTLHKLRLPKRALNKSWTVERYYKSLTNGKNRRIVTVA